MTTRLAIRTAGLTLLSVAVASGTSTAQDLPRVKGKEVVAVVQGEPITLDEFNRHRAALRQALAPGATPDRRAELALLDRLIHMVLIAQEAKRMELDKLPEVRKPVESFARTALREELVEQIAKGVKADPKEVEQLYQASVREWKVSAALFANEAHAQFMAAEAGAGKDFGELTRTYLAEGKATQVEDGVVLKPAAMDPEVREAVSKLAVGSTTPVISTKSGFVVLRLEEVRHPDDPAARAEAEQTVLARARTEAVRAFDQALRKKHVKVDREVLNSLDYEAETPGMEALAKDRRVLARVEGEPPLTVADLTEQLKFQFFHGLKLAAERKRLNASKEAILDGVLHRRLFRREALRRGLHKTASYQSKVRDHERVVLFEAFLRKAVARNITFGEEELKAYYQAHRDEYATPEMMRIKGLALADRGDAERALESLRKGADFQWVANHAGAQVDASAKGVLTFDGRPLMVSELPEEVQKALAGARAGDARFYASPEGHFYALAVQGVVAAQPQPYEQVRKEIVEKVLGAKVQKAVEEYAGKLRSLSDVKVYLKAS